MLVERRVAIIIAKSIENAAIIKQIVAATARNLGVFVAVEEETKKHLLITYRYRRSATSTVAPKATATRRKETLQESLTVPASAVVFL
jgi:hypothetical protein